MALKDRPLISKGVSLYSLKDRSSVKNSIVRFILSTAQGDVKNKKSMLAMSLGDMTEVRQAPGMSGSDLSSCDVKPSALSYRLKVKISHYELNTVNLDLLYSVIPVFDRYIFGLNPDHLTIFPC